MFRLATSMGYKQLSTSEPGEEDSHRGFNEKVTKSIRPQLHWFGRRRNILVAFCLVMLFTIMSTLAYFSDSKWNLPHRHEFESCGTSPDKAHALGCKFDVMSFSWLPSRCYDGQLTSDFLAAKPWQWYADENKTKVVDIAEVQSGMHDSLFVTMEYHMYHCTFMWKKMHRAILAGQPLDGYIANLMHTTHCEMMLLDWEVDLNMTNTIIQTKFVTCPIKSGGVYDTGYFRPGADVESEHIHGYHRR